MAKHDIRLRSEEESAKLYGSLDEHLRHAEERYGVKVTARNTRLRIVGEPRNVERAVAYFQKELEAIRSGVTRAAEQGEKGHPSGGL